MSNPPLFHALNDAQQTVVTAPEGHLLVLAGAGSGKTRVLVHRIVWLVENKFIPPDRILAVTFTNKAANEMRGRIESMLSIPAQRLWMGTFHGIAHKLLRLHWQQAGLPQTFQVIDNDDQLRLVRRILKNMNLDETRWPPKQAQWFINAQKEECRRAKQVSSEGDLFTETYKRVYEKYEELCLVGGLVDFGELLLKSYELWETQPELLAHYQQRFLHILVDEFQDTNHIQYRWLKKLAGPVTQLMIVGDDDQSIYSWRGAKVEHLQHFIQDFPNTQIIRLEQNYRSTSTILNAANALIAHNEYRLGKNLWTQGKAGELITLYTAFNDRDEAAFIMRQIQYWINQGGSRREIAILYRSNAQSRVFEEALIHMNIPYRVYGGLRFFERVEIKDALAYLRLLANPHDDSAFDRVVNVPTRGIGETTLTAIKDYAGTANVSLWQASQAMIASGHLPTRAASALQNFLTLVEQITLAVKNMDLQKLTHYTLEKSGLLFHYQQDQSEKGLARVENLTELVNATHQFVPDNDAYISPLTEFLSKVALESGDEGVEANDCVQLMTLHSAKGLEFPLVFLTGMEEGLFPHVVSSQNPQQLEEERRLCYVGMTRAMSKLYLTYAQSRYLHGKEMYRRPSRFIEEIPLEFLSTGSSQVKISRPTYQPSSRAGPASAKAIPANVQGELSIGCQVEHPLFGKGTVLNFEGTGKNAKVQVRFASGTKWIVMSYLR